jgi:hypothetical protein
VLRDGVPGLEIIVVDDGSTDDTADVVEARSAMDPRVRLVRSPENVGVSNARNLGLDVVRGAWLTFLDADDVLLPGGLAAMVEASQRDGVRAVVGQRVWTDGRTRWLTAAYDRPDIRQPGRKSLVSHPGLLFYASGTGKLFHEATFQGLRFHGRVLGDQPWTVRALLRADHGIEVIATDVYEWRRPVSEVRTSITAAKRGSARVAAEAARVAVGALAEVASEAATQIDVPEDRAHVVGGYFDRLVRSDLEGPVSRAIASDDGGGAALFEAVLAFLKASPDGLVDRSTSVVQGLVIAPLDYWGGARPVTRATYLDFLGELMHAFPSVGRRLPAWSVTRLALARLGRQSRGAAGDPVVQLLLTLRWPAALLHRLRRPGRRPAPRR